MRRRGAGDDGRIFTNADRISPADANAILLHEAFHSGRDSILGGKTWAALMKRLDALYQQFARSGGKARGFFEATAAWVANAEDFGPLSKSDCTEKLGA